MTGYIEQTLIFQIACHVRIDKHGSGQITFGEFEEFFRDEAVKAFFESLQIGAMDAWTLFVSLVPWIAQGIVLHVRKHLVTKQKKCCARGRG